MTTKKKIITSVKEYYDIKSVVRDDVFRAKYTLSDEVTCALLAEGAMVNVEFVDSRMLTTDEKEAFIKNS